MNRGLLALGAALVLALVIGLYAALRGDSCAIARDPVEPPRDQKIPERGSGKTWKVPRAPTPAASGDAPARADGSPEVRDHRTGTPQAAPAEPPPVRRPDGRQINREITADLSQKLRPLVRECTASVAPEAHGEKARIEGQIVIAIKAGQATVTSASFALRDVADAAQPAIKQCLVERVVGLAAPGGAEADLDDYAIGLSMSWP